MSDAFSRTETAQEGFWAGEFGNSYIQRNDSSKIVRSNIALFSKVLARTNDIGTLVEFGANIGNNLRAIHVLNPNIKLNAVEINEQACNRLREFKELTSVKLGSILTYKSDETFDLSLSKGLLIHIHPDHLPLAYNSLYQASHRYVLLCEYYNPTPVNVVYRGHDDRLFKRDFAGDMMSIYSDLRLLDYGFVYRNDPVFPQDDLTWFLMEKRT
jgi:spore coat polysaccharide biosynthesis protein SpsF